MSKILLRKSGPLKGTVEASGSKNSVLPLLAATLLSEEPCTIMDVPDLDDVDAMCQILKSLGATVEIDKENHEITVVAKNIVTNEPPEDLVKTMRASVLTMGPLLARTGRAKISLPGGCAIGDRPIDLHQKGFLAMCAEVEKEEDQEKSGHIEAIADRLIAAEIYLDSPSVGATENLMMAAVLADGETIIENAAQEPEIVDLANYLNKMGAKIKGAGMDIIRIKGVEKLHGANHAVIPDRIEASTYMLAAAITRGDITITNMITNHVKPIIAKLRECGVTVEETVEGTRVYVQTDELKSTDIKTLPYPGFPTDVQPQFMTFLSTVNGPSNVLETVFENRFMHIDELNKMGANILEDGRKAIIRGNSSLVGAKVKATDLRAGAALIIAGLVAEGETLIEDCYHIDRGYELIIEKFDSLGAIIERIED